MVVAHSALSVDNYGALLVAERVERARSMGSTTRRVCGSRSAHARVDEQVVQTLVRAILHVEARCCCHVRNQAGQRRGEVEKGFGAAQSDSSIQRVRVEQSCLGQPA